MDLKNEGGVAMGYPRTQTTMVTPPAPVSGMYNNVNNVVPHALAKRYSDALPRKVTAKDVAGCYAYSHCFGSSVLHTYHADCGPDCVCVCPCVCGVPTALCCVCLGQCERDGNGWVTRDKHGIRTGEMLVIDLEAGTHASYALQCCSHEFKQEPCCIATRVKGGGCCVWRSVEIKA
jgi:hypothetical protein